MDQQTPQREPKAGAARVNGDAVRRFRHQAGFSQKILALRSGYTEKLIQKAESSGMLRQSTIRDLAQALCTADQNVTVSDLLFEAEVLARQLVEQVICGPPMSHAQLTMLVNRNVRLNVAGNPKECAFAGSFNGTRGIIRFQTAWHSGFDSISMVSNSIQLYIDGSNSCLHAKLRLEKTRQPVRTIWMFLRVWTEDQKASLLEFYFDTSAVF